MSERRSVKRHEEQYWHVPKMALLPLVGVLFFGVLSCLNFFLLDWSFLNKEVAQRFVFADFVMVCPFFGEYFFVVCLVVSLFALVKGGYGNLKPVEENDLIAGLIWGLIWGLIGEFD